MRTLIVGFNTLLLGVGLIGLLQLKAFENESSSSGTDVDSLEAYTETIPGTVAEFDMVPVPGGSVTVEGPEGSTEEVVGPFWMGITEVQWDAYDAYRLGDQMDDLDEAQVDAISLPSRPYGFGSKIPGFGRKEYPAMAVTRKAARAYTQWLSAKTGRTYRLPTAAEWKHACQAGYGTPREWTEDQLATYAWFAAGRGGDAQPVGMLEPNDLGIFDQLGNAAEHVAPWGGDSEQPVVVWGGSYRSAAEDVHCASQDQKTDAWQESDPQLPKSEWWLSDAPFVGFRLVRVPDADGS